MIKSCKYCKQKFQVTPKLRLYCSLECKDLYLPVLKEQTKLYMSLYKKQYMQKNKLQLKQKGLLYRLKNKTRIKKYNKRYRKLHKSQRASYNRQYTQTHKPLRNLHRRSRYTKDINYRIQSCLRTRLYMALTGHLKANNTKTLLGCSIAFLKLWLELQFQDGMSWNNWGSGEYKWQIDHIRPCCEFNFLYVDQQEACFHFTNLQPLWAKDNLEKRYKEIV